MAHSDSTNPIEPLDSGAGAMIRRHQRGLWRYLRMLGCDTATADDLTQDTFLRVLRKDSFVEHNDAATAGYLRRTAYNLLVSRYRREERVHSFGDSAELDEQWDRWAGKDLSGDRTIDVLKLCIGRLTERAQKALHHRFSENATRVQVGQKLGISDHGARNLLQRAKQQLRQCVEQQLHHSEET